jgi:C-terminal processing protease CtpA/Prc
MPARPKAITCACFAGACLVGIVALAPLGAQTFDKMQQERAKQMVRDVADAMRKHYFDPSYRGIDMDARFRAAIDSAEKATNLGAAFAAIAEALEPLNDSHTFFIPPSRSTRRETGYTQQMIGDRCFITAVRPGTDATEKLAPGDQVVTWQDYAPTRESLPKMNYAFIQLYAAPSMHLKIRHPDGSEATVDVATKSRQEKRVLDLTGGGDGSDIWQVVRESENEDRLMRQRVVDYGEKLAVWKMPEFDLTEDQVDRIIKDARRHQFLVMDLRGNPGGLVKTLQYIVSSTIDHDVTIATRKGRKSDLKPITAKTHGSSVFQGKLIVLIDSRSASAAELFARVVQLEHRGTVIGDTSSGMVMESRYYPFSQGANTQIMYGASITDADLVMTDGKSLEHNGVVPDEALLPTAADLAQGRDPVLSHAAELAGVALDPRPPASCSPSSGVPSNILCIARRASRRVKCPDSGIMS